MRAPFPHPVQHRRHLLLLLLCGVSALLLPMGLAWVCPACLEPVELWTVDLRFQLRPPLPVSSEFSSSRAASQDKSDAIVVIDYDDQAARDFGLGRWPWDRRVHAQVLDWLRQAGAKVIVVDLHFDRATDPAQDRALVEATRRTGNVFFPIYFVPVFDPQGRVPIPTAFEQHVVQAEISGTGALPNVGQTLWPLSELAGVAEGFGHNQRTTDRDGSLRRIPLFYETPQGLLPALALAAAWHYLDVDPETIRLERGHALTFTPRDRSRITIPVDEQGRAWINYAGPWKQRFRHVPYSWLRHQMESGEGRRLLPDWFHDKAVVVTNLTSESGDQGAMPFERDFPFGEVHAHLLNMVLTQQVLRDAQGAERAIILGTPIILLTGTALLGGAGLIATTGVLLLILVLLVALWTFAHAGVVLPVVIPSLTLIVGLPALLAARVFLVDQDRRRFLSVLGAVLPPSVFKELQQDPARLSHLLTGRRQELTILFADLVGFSAFSYKADPLEVQRVLREYRTALTEVLHAHGGTLEKYTGDEVMAFFGDAEPDDGDDERQEKRVERHAANAVRAGLAIQRSMQVLNERWRQQGRETHLIRVGISTGPVTIGNFGTEQLWQYGIVGAEVSKTKRLEGAAEPGGLLLGRRTYALARKQGILPTELPATTAMLKGFGQDTEVYPVPPTLIAELSEPVPKTPR